MTVHSIPDNINISQLYDAITYKLRLPAQFSFKYENDIPIAITFSPELSALEEQTFNSIVSYVLSINDFNVLPNWATWTANEVETNIANSIFNGQDITTIKANIAAQLTNITIANVSQINTRLDVIRTLFGNAVDAIITIRTIMIAMGKAIIYLRNLVIKIR